MATATNQDILQAYQQSVGAGEGQVNTQLLIQALRDRQRKAVEEDAMKAERWKSGGKLGLNALKARRDFLLAKRANPDLKFTQFMSDPQSAGKYMEQGSSLIASGKEQPIGLRETFGLGRKKIAEQKPFFGEKEVQKQMEKAMKNNPNFAKNFMSEKQFNTAPQLEGGIMSPEYNLPSQPVAPPPPMGDVTGAGLQNTLLSKPDNIMQQAAKGISPSTLPPSSQIDALPLIQGSKANPIMLPPVDAVTSTANNISPIQGPMGDMIQKVPVNDPLAGASTVKQGLGQKALGSVGGILQTLKGAKGMAKEGANIGNVSQSLGGMATLAGLGPIGLGLGLMGGIASLRRRK